MAIGGHPDHGMSGVASQGSAGTGMESAFGGAAIGVPGGAPAGQNEMGAFLEAMTQRYGPQSVKNFVDNYLTRQQKQMDQMREQMRGPFPPGGRRAFGGMPSPGTAVATAVQNNPVAAPESTTPQAQINRTPFDQFGLNYFDEGVYGTHPAVGNMFDSPAKVSPELEMSGRMTPAQLAQLEQTFEAYADPSVLADAMPAPNYGPAYGGGGDYRRRYMSDI